MPRLQSRIRPTSCQVFLPTYNAARPRFGRTVRDPDEVRAINGEDLPDRNEFADVSRTDSTRPVSRRGCLVPGVSSWVSPNDGTDPVEHRPEAEQPHDTL